MNRHIREAIESCSRGPLVNKSALSDALERRENGIADSLRITATQFNLYSFIVDEVIATVGLGTEPTEPDRRAIRARFEAGMTQLQEAIERQRREQGDGT